MTWHVLTTYEHGEFRVRDAMHKAGISSLVPAVLFRLGETARYHRRPLIPEYVFVSADGRLLDWPAVLRTPYVSGRLSRVGDEAPAELGYGPILDMMRAAEEATEVAMSMRRQANRPLRVGDHVIEPGTGIHAAIDAITRRSVLVTVTMLGQARRVTIDKTKVQLMPEPAL